MTSKKNWPDNVNLNKDLELKVQVLTYDGETPRQRLEMWGSREDRLDRACQRMDRTDLRYQIALDLLNNIRATHTAWLDLIIIAKRSDDSVRIKNLYDKAVKKDKTTAKDYEWLLSEDLS